METITASKAKNNFGYLLDEVRIKGKTIVITKNKRPIAKISPNYSYETTKTEPALTLSDSEYEKVKTQVKKAKNSFKFTF